MDIPSAFTLSAYKLLEVDPTSTDAEIQAAYHDLRKLWNPEHFLNDLEMKARVEAKAKEIEAAFAVVMMSRSAPGEVTVDSSESSGASTNPEPAEMTSPPVSPPPPFDVAPAVDTSPTALPDPSPETTPPPSSPNLKVLFAIMILLIIGGLISPVSVAWVLFRSFEPIPLLLLIVAFWLFYAAGKQRKEGRVTDAGTTVQFGCLMVFLYCVALGYEAYSAAERARNPYTPPPVPMSKEVGEWLEKDLQAKSPNTPPPAPVSPADEARALEIMKNTLFQEGYLTPEIHAQFWSILDRAEPDVEVAVTKAKDTLAFKTECNRRFYADALISYRTRQPYKSPQREQDEKALVAKGISSEAAIKRSNDFMKRIAAHKPQEVQGNTIIVDEALIQLTMDNMDGILNRAKQLLTRPAH